MSKEAYDKKMREKLHNVRVEEKIKLSFSAAVLSFSIFAILAISNVLVYAHIAGGGVFSSPIRIDDFHIDFYCCSFPDDSCESCDADCGTHRRNPEGNQAAEAWELFHGD